MYTAVFWVKATFKTAYRIRTVILFVALDFPIRRVQCFASRKFDSRKSASYSLRLSWIIRLVSRRKKYSSRGQSFNVVRELLVIPVVLSFVRAPHRCCTVYPPVPKIVTLQCLELENEMFTNTCISFCETDELSCPHRYAWRGRGRSRVPSRRIYRTYDMTCPPRRRGLYMYSFAYESNVSNWSSIVIL